MPMRTTIDIPDPLARQAKIAAVHRHSTLREVIIQALEKELNGREAGVELPRGASSALLPRLPTAGRKPYDLTPEQVDSALFSQG